MPEQDSPQSKSNIKKILGGLGILISLIAVIGVIAVSGTFTKVKVENLSITNLTSNSATVVWTTNLPAQAYVEVSSRTDFKDKIVFYDDRDIEEVGAGEYELQKPTSRLTHHVTLRGLKPEEEYYYKIVNNRQAYDGNELKFSTVIATENLKTPDPVYGRINKKDGGLVEEGVVILQKISEEAVSQKVSTVLQEGTYSIDASNLYNEELDSEFVQADYTQELNVLGVDQGVSKTKIVVAPEADQPVEDIIQGEDKVVEATTQIQTLAEEKYGNTSIDNNCCNVPTWNGRPSNGCQGDDWKKGYAACVEQGQCGCTLRKGMEEQEVESPDVKVQAEYTVDLAKCTCTFDDASKKDKYCKKVDGQYCEFGKTMQKHCNAYKGVENRIYAEEVQGNPLNCGTQQQNYVPPVATEQPPCSGNGFEQCRLNNLCVELKQNEYSEGNGSQNYPNSNCIDDQVVVKMFRHTDGNCGFNFVRCTKGVKTGTGNNDQPVGSQTPAQSAVSVCNYNDGDRGSNTGANEKYDGSCWIKSLKKDDCRKGDKCGTTTQGQCKCGSEMINSGDTCTDDSVKCEGAAASAQPAAPDVTPNNPASVVPEANIVSANNTITVNVNISIYNIPSSVSDAEKAKMNTPTEATPLEVSTDGKYVRLVFASGYFCGWADGKELGVDTSKLVKVTAPVRCDLTKGLQIGKIRFEISPEVTNAVAELPSAAIDSMRKMYLYCIVNPETPACNGVGTVEAATIDELARKAGAASSEFSGYIGSWINYFLYCKANPADAMCPKPVAGSASSSPSTTAVVPVGLIVPDEVLKFVRSIASTGLNSFVKILEYCKAYPATPACGGEGLDEARLRDLATKAGTVLSDTKSTTIEMFRKIAIYCKTYPATTECGGSGLDSAKLSELLRKAEEYLKTVPTDLGGTLERIAEAIVSNEDAKAKGIAVMKYPSGSSYKYKMIYSNSISGAKQEGSGFAQIGYKGGDFNVNLYYIQGATKYLAISTGSNNLIIKNVLSDTELATYQGLDISTLGVGWDPNIINFDPPASGVTIYSEDGEIEIDVYAQDPSLMEPGKYAIGGTNTTTKEFTLTVPGKVVYFQDLNGDGIKQDNEPLYDGDVASLNIQFNKVSEVQSYNIKSGWSLISFPILMRGDGTANIVKASDLLKKMNEGSIVATQVVAFRSGKFLPYSYRKDEKGNEVKFGDDFSILPGEAYFIRSYSTGNFNVNGNKIQNAQEIGIENGWNLVGFYNSNKLSFKGFEILGQLGTAGVKADTLSKWEDGMYYTIVSQDTKQYGNDFSVYPYQGYFLRVTDRGAGKFKPV